MKDLITRLRDKCKLLHQCVEMRAEAADVLEEFVDAARAVLCREEYADDATVDGSTLNALRAAINKATGEDY